MAKRKANQKVAERPKTRKELRKDKRTQKKANRVHFHKRKKELKIEYRERLKQQKKNAGKGGKNKRANSSGADSADEEEDVVQDDDIYDQADMSSGDEADDPNVRGENDSDEEIESDFTLSDDELEQKFAGRVKKPAQPAGKKAKKPKPSDHEQFDADLLKEKQKQRQLEKAMRKQRVKQLRAANEDEDKMIRKLEKQLKIDKKRSEKHVPTMFNDGLEYALELCLPENIQKMYTAAKEAVENEEDSDSGFQEDLAMAMGETTKGKSKKRKRDETQQKESDSADPKESVAPKKRAKDVAEEVAARRSAQKMAKLRAAESKYFGSDDDLDSDLSGNDSEYEHDSDDEVLEVPNANQKKKKMPKGGRQEADDEEDDEFGDDFGLQDDENDFEDDESDEEDDEEDDEDDDESDDDEGPEEVHKAKKLKGKQTVIEEEDDYSDESDGSDDFDEESEEEEEVAKPPAKKAKTAQPEKNNPKASKKSAPVEPDSDDFGDGDDDFDEDVFGLSSGDEEEQRAAGQKKKQERSYVWEDIYGRTRDKAGNIITVKPSESAAAAPSEASGAPTKYVPPHMRARLEAAAAASATGSAAAHPLDADPKRREKLDRLRKQLKGYINRLSEANIHRIATDIENVYMQNSRHDVNQTLTQLIEAALVTNVLAPERMVLEHVMLIAALHANVGSEVGAHFLQHFIERLSAQLAAIDTFDVDDKRLDNVLFILCHMYTFRMFQHQLIYEILGHLTAGSLSEKAVECVLLALRSIGFALRKDDAIALKDLIVVLQRQAAETNEELRNNPRLRYMLDVLLAIKNNNVQKIPSYDPALAEHLRKILRTMLVNGKYVTTLNITLDDLLRADSKGKWWVVGSAWTGNLSDMGAAAQTQQTAKQTAAYAEATRFSEQILALAKQHRMNTDDRRNVFCVLMSAEDYLDAFEKLHHLGIRDHKVIVTVIIHCCLSGGEYNPYFAVLAQKFCDFDRKYQLAVQYALWDRIREVASGTTALQVKNMAQFMAHLIEHGGLALSVLKVVEFGELDKVTLRLVRQIVLALLMGAESVCRQVFGRIAPSGNLKAFKDSLRLFLHHFLMKGGAKSGVPEDKMELLRARIRLADKALESVDSRVKF